MNIYRKTLKIAILLKYKNTKRITNKLQEHQCIEQAKFKNNFSTCDHFQTTRILIEKTLEYNLNLWAFVDFQHLENHTQTVDI